MYFNEIEIENYKCFKEPVSLKLEPGINIILGKNNSGKTALIEAISLQFVNKPYLSLETFSKPTKPPRKKSKVRVTFTLSKDELIELLGFANNGGDGDFLLPAETKPPDRRFKIRDFEEDLIPAYKTFASTYFSNNEYTFKLEREVQSDTKAIWRVLDDTYLSPRLQRIEDGAGFTQYYVRFRLDPDAPLGIEAIEAKTVSGGSSREDFSRRIALVIDQRAEGTGEHIYRFQAERKPAESSPLNENRKLLSNSSNLAEVLHYYLSNVALAKKYNQLVRQVIPNIHQVSVQTFKENGINCARVLIWNSQNSRHHDWLGLPLSDLGSGVGQVLAILYVLMASTDPQIVLIDEPDSFLHPDATRKLIELLRVYGKRHEIIIATHTPSIVASSEPSSVTLISQKGSKSILQNIDLDKMDSQSICLGEVGARLSDVFGYDRVVWVEGIAEEICFPRILRRFQGVPTSGTAILQVHRTGDFENKNTKDVDRIIDIYERLSSAEGGLVPSAVCYILDRESRSPEEVVTKRKKYPKLHFIPRKLYENYLLNPAAIAATINNFENRKTTSSDEIKEWIDEKKTLKRYYNPDPLPAGQESWVDLIHGKRLLADLFDEFCTDGSNRNFKSKMHSVSLTEWILDNSPGDLEELATFLIDVIKSKR